MKKLIAKILRRAGFKIIKIKKGFHYVHKIYGQSSHKMRDLRTDRFFHSLAKPVVRSGRTSLYYDRLYQLFQGLRNIVSRSPAQDTINIVDVGTYRGGSSYFLASLAEKLAPGRSRLWSIDTFEGYPKEDLPDGIEGSYLVPGKGSDVNFEEVVKYLSDFRFVKVIKSRIQDCAPTLAGRTFHFVHLDVNLYKPTNFALGFFGARMKSGGIIIVDDYEMITCPGIKEAVDRYSAEHRAVTKFSFLTGQCILIFP